MKHWEVDVEVRVRKTLIFAGAQDAEHAEAMVKRFCLEAGINMPLSTFQKWVQVEGYGVRQPVETVIDNDPQIVAVREVAES